MRGRQVKHYMNAITQETLLQEIQFNADGLIPVIAQDAATRNVLMHAWMNHDALALTLQTGQMHYWSRSRGALWRKGETSGHTQALRTLYLDCDGDTLLALVEQTGPACHTGAANCFFRRVDGSGSGGE